jgi:hypothetical protein
MNTELKNAVEQLIAEVEKTELEYAAARSEKRRIENRKLRIETDIARRITFEEGFKNEAQRNVAQSLARFKNDEWVKLHEIELPEIDNKCILLYFKMRRQHEWISAHLGGVVNIHSFGIFA